jgi:hypothetical protein
LKKWNWPYYYVAEDDAVREDIPGHFRIAIGGKVEMKSKKAELGGEAPVVAVFSPMPD